MLSPIMSIIADRNMANMKATKKIDIDIVSFSSASLAKRFPSKALEKESTNKVSYQHKPFRF